VVVVVVVVGGGVLTNECISLFEHGHSTKNINIITQERCDVIPGFSKLLFSARSPWAGMVKLLNSTKITH